jgi:centromere protein I
MSSRLCIVRNTFLNRAQQQDSEWRTRLLAIQNTASIAQGRSATGLGGFSLSRNGVTKKNSMIPEVHTFHAAEVRLLLLLWKRLLTHHQASVILEDIDSVESFVNNLERLEPPSQLIAGLSDPLVQKYLLLNKSADSVRRLEFWLETNFEAEIEILQEGFGLSPSLTEILSALLSYTEFTKVWMAC